MADDPAVDLIAPYAEFAPPTSDNVPELLALIAAQAVAAASLDPVGVTDGPGHLAAFGLVIGAGNYYWTSLGPDDEMCQVIVAFTAALLQQLGYPEVHGWRQN